MNRSRRVFLGSGIGCAAGLAGLIPNELFAATQSSIGESDLYVVSDGHISLPRTTVLPNIDDQDSFLQSRNLNTPQFKSSCNLTLWRNDKHLVLFDVGGGPNFLPTTGNAAEDLSSLGIDPADITDVVFTHAHPDHLWGLIDDFDELLFPSAEYHMNAKEWDFWWDENTVNTVPEFLQSFAVGARNRMAYLQEGISLFSYGDEVLPGVEALDTHGHTPGHTSYALHHGSNSLVVTGDALTHPVLSFEKAQWVWGTDQDPEAAKSTRLKLLDQLTQDKLQILGFHLPHPGLGSVERSGNAYRFVGS